MKKLILCALSILFFSPALRAEPDGEILSIPANPKKGFNWGYALYLPTTINSAKTLPMLLIMGNTGRIANAEETEKTILRRLPYQSNEGPVAKSLGVPLVMPMVPRQEDFYTHALSRAVMVSKDKNFKRLDLQVLNIIKDARKQLKKRGIKTEEKVLVTGFSAAGVFAWRWTMLHPEYVLATVTGGALYHMLPVEELNGEKLIYPVGVGDFEELTGKKFNKKAWSKIPILSTNGEKDDNDTFVYKECFDPDEERIVLEKVLPGKNVFERRAQSIQLLHKLAPNVQTYLYPWLAHQPVSGDVAAFLKKHINGGPLKPFTPTDTSNRKPGQVHIVNVFWGKDMNIPEEYKDLFASVEPDDLILQTDVDYPYWLYREYGKIDILHKDKKVTQVDRSYSVTVDGKSIIGYKLSPMDWGLLRAKKDRTFTLRSQKPEFFEIPKKLTFTIQ